MVLLNGHRNPSIRGGLQLVQESVARLKESECSALEQEYNEDGTLKEFKSPVLNDFSIDDKVSLPSSVDIPAPADVQSEKGVEHWIRAVKSGSERLGGSITSNKTVARA